MIINGKSGRRPSGDQGSPADTHDDVGHISIGPGNAVEDLRDLSIGPARASDEYGPLRN